MLEEAQIENFFTNEDELLKIIGYSDEQTYNYLMKKIFQKSISYKNCKIYSEGFKLPCDIEIIKIIQDSLSSMNVYALDNEDIVLSSDTKLNCKIKKAISQILQPLIINKQFKNETIRLNFIVKHIVWIYERINEFEWFSGERKPIAILYGEFNEDEIYHIEIMNLIGFKIIYINSSRDVILNKFSQIKENIISFCNVSPIQRFNIRVSNGTDILNDSTELNSQVDNNDKVITTWAKQAKDELHKELCSSEGVFAPWQFKKGTTKQLYINAVIEDIETYWAEDAKFRPGFKIEGLTVNVPSFMTKINGAYSDIGKYKKLIDFTKNAKLTLFKEGVFLIDKSYTKEEMYSLMFTIDEDELNYEKIKAHKLYRLNKLNIDVQHYLLKKINDFLKLYKNEVDMKDILDLIATILTLSDDYLNLIENFDFPFKIPKLVIYIHDRSSFDKRTGLFINYLNTVGFDIIIYSPIGSNSIEEHMYSIPLNVITLDEMNFDLEYSKLKDIKIKGKTSLLKKLFNI